MKNIFSLEGKTSVVTGGAGHLGAAICEALAQHGSKVIAIGRNENDLKRIKSSHVNISYDIGDVTEEKNFNKILQKISSKYGSLDVLVNNAFCEQRKPLSEITKKEWQVGMDNILTQKFTCMQSAINIMLKQPKGGSIINIGSIYGSLGVNPKTYTEVQSSSAFYAAAKAGVIQLTKYAAAQYSSQGIKVNCISPGPFPKPPPPSHVGRPGYIVDLASQIPMKRVGLPHEIGGAAVFLASEASSFVAGHNLIVDGGFSIW